MIAELLRCWGIDAHANDRSKGEIDVGFTLDGVRYVLEAKWEHNKADTGHIAKLQKRVRQRLAGTYGVFLAMSGYTADALAEVADGERLEVLLLDRSHWEAMLCGVVPPQEMLSLARDHAAFHGAAYATVPTLFATRARRPEIDFAESMTSVVDSAAEGCSATSVLSVIESDQLGIACGSTDELLLTTAAGIVRADLRARTAAVAVPIPACHRNALPLDDGSILLTRRFGVARFHDGVLTSVAGGAAGNNFLIQDSDRGIWLVDNGEPSRPTPPSICRIGDHLGEQTRHDLDYPPAAAANAAWISASDLLIIGNPGFRIVTLEGGQTPLRQLPVSNSMGLTRTSGSRTLIAGAGITVAAIDTASGKSSKLMRLALRDSITELAQAPSGEVYLAAYEPGQTYRWAVIHLEVVLPAEFHSGVSMHAKRPDTPGATESDPAAHSLGDEPAASQAGAKFAAPELDVPFDDAVAALTNERRQEWQRGYHDGVRFAPQLGWQSLDGLANRDFDLKRWLESWRNGWLDVQMDRAPTGATAAAWLPALADLLGSYVDPIGYDQWSFTPSRSYLDGFVDGLRAVWANAAATQPGRIQAATNPLTPPSPAAPNDLSDDPGKHGPDGRRKDPAATSNRRHSHLSGNSDSSSPVQPAHAQSDFIAVKGILGSITFDGETVTIRKEGYGPRMKGIKELPVREIEQVLVKPATAMFHGFIQFVTRDHPPAPDRRLSTASGRPHREDPDSMSYPRRANQEIEKLRVRIETAIMKNRRA
jgi:hypothetical protein